MALGRETVLVPTRDAELLRDEVRAVAHHAVLERTAGRRGPCGLPSSRTVLYALALQAKCNAAVMFSMPPAMTHDASPALAAAAAAA